MSESKLDVLNRLAYYDTENLCIRSKLPLRKDSKVFANPNCGFIMLWDAQTSRVKKFYPHNAVWMLFNQKDIPPGYKVLHVDLNRDNLHPSNLRIVPKSLFRQIMSTLRNLHGDLKIEKHKMFADTYVVSWVEGGMKKTAIRNDIGNAQEVYRQKKYEFLKFLNQHIKTS